jgi:endo-1,4-beta-mannosidase
METIFGARLVDTNIVSDVTLKVVEPLGGLKPGDTFHFSVPGSGPRFWGSLLEVKGGKVIAVDQDGRPALVANTIGMGKTLLSAYPIESYLANTPSAFEKPENTHRIYEAFRKWTGVKPAFQSDQPSVEVTSLRGDHRGYAVVVNHSAQAYKTTISTSLPVTSVRQMGPENSKALPMEGSTWRMDLDPYEAVIVEWK